MKLEQLKKIVNKAYNEDLTNPSRKHQYKIPRFVFCHYARKYLKSPRGKTITYDEIAIFLDKNHATITNAIKGYDSLMSYYPDAEVISQIIEVKIKKKLGIKPTKKEITILESEKVEIRDCEKAILKALKDVSDSDILNFTETRLQPFLSMLKSRVVHKDTTVLGAKRKFFMN